MRDDADGPDALDDANKAARVSRCESVDLQYSLAVELGTREKV